MIWRDQKKVQIKWTEVQSWVDSRLPAMEPSSLFCPFSEFQHNCALGFSSSKWSGCMPLLCSRISLSGSLGATVWLAKWVRSQLGTWNQHYHHKQTVLEVNVNFKWVGGRVLEDLSGRATTVAVRARLLRAGGKHLQKALVLSLSRCRGTGPLDTTSPVPSTGPLQVQRVLADSPLFS